MTITTWCSCKRRHCEPIKDFIEEVLEQRALF
jgi:hypothetical protein